jgi:hypothetical protein
MHTPRKGDKVKIYCIAPQRAGPPSEAHLGRYCHLAGSDCLHRTQGMVMTVQEVLHDDKRVNFSPVGCCPLAALTPPKPPGPVQGMLFKMEELEKKAPGMVHLKR